MANKKTKTTAKKQIIKAEANKLKPFNVIMDNPLIEGTKYDKTKEETAPAKGPVINSLPVVKTKSGEIKIDATDKQIQTLVNTAKQTRDFIAVDKASPQLSKHNLPLKTTIGNNWTPADSVKLSTNATKKQQSQQQKPKTAFDLPSAFPELNKFEYGVQNNDPAAERMRYWEKELGIGANPFIGLINGYSQDEIDRFNLFADDDEKRLMNTLSNNGRIRYMREIMPQINQRYIKKVTEVESKSNPFVASLMARGSNLMAGFEAVDNVVDALTKGKVDTYDATGLFARKAAAADENVYKSINKNIKNPALNTLTTMGYGALSSGIDMGLQLITGSALGSTGALGNGAKAVSNFVGRSLALNAASHGMNSAADRGGNDEQILLSGVLNGVAELAFEKFSIENILKTKNVTGWLGKIKEIGKQALIEGREEGFTEIANLLTDAAVMREKSESQIKLRQYLADGLSYEEAEKNVFNDNLTQVAMAAGTGALSGGFLGTFNAEINASNTKRTVENIKNDPSSMGIIRELYRNGFKDTTADADVKMANAIIKLVNNKATQADERLISENETARNLVQIIAGNTETAQAIRAAYAEKPKPAKIETPLEKKTNTKQPTDSKKADASTDKNVVEIKPKAKEIAEEMSKRAKKGIIVVPEKITSILDKDGKRTAFKEHNGILFVDENTLNKEYDAMYENGKKLFPFEEAMNVTNPVILDKQAAKDAYNMGVKAAKAEADNSNVDYTKELFETPENSDIKTTEDFTAEAFGKNAGQIIQNEAAEEMKRIQPKAYANIEQMAKELGTRVTFAKGLVNEKGQKLDGKIDGDGIVINTEAEDPIRFAATHEFGHRMKQLDPDAWGKYQNHVIKYWQKQGTYDVKMRALKNVYGESMSIEELHEELACDFGEQMFRNEKTLSEFIKKDRTLAEKVKDVWFKVLSAFSDKARLRHAQNLWAKAYREAAGKVEDSGEFGKTKYSFAGENAKTANIATLNTAKEMEINGESEETIWKETGWSKGPDRKWRFEINDIDSFLIENPTVNLHKDIDGDYYTGKLPDVLNHEELFKAYPSLRTVDVIIQETNPGIGGTAFPKSNQIVLSETLFRKLSSEYEDLINNRQKYIDEIESTPEYKEYNAIYEMPDGDVSPEEWLELVNEATNKFFSSELGKRYYELVWGEDKNVKKYEIGWSEKAKEALIHEIEHLIQYKEGFASGASVGYWQKQLDKGFDSRTKEEKKTLAKLQNEFYEIIKTDPEFFREMEKLTSMKPDVPRGAINWQTLEKIEEDPIEWKNYDKKLNELEEKFGAEKVSKFIFLNSRIEEQKKKGRTASDLYYNTAGEREARNAAERINMTADERRNKFPESFKSDDYIVFAEEGVGNDAFSKQKISGVKEAEANVEREILIEENKRLRDQIENMHIQLDQAEGKGLDLKKVKELATKLKETYHSTMPINEIHQELSKIYSSMTRQNVDGQEVYSRIYNLASNMVNSAIVKNDEQSMMYADLLDRMRKTRIVVPESERADFTEGYNEYRKHAMGKLTLANSGIDIDTFWNEISKEYPHLFDGDLVGAKAKLDALLEVRNDLQPVYESFFGEDESYISKVKTYLANNIMNGFFKIPEKEGSTKYVFYDKRAAQIEKEAQKALKKAEEQFDKTITRLERKYVRGELKHSIDRDFGFLKNMSENPTNSRHVPQEMQGGVSQMLKLFDYGTKDAESLRESGKQKAKVKGVKLFKLADAYEKIIRDAFGLNGLRDDNNIVADKVLWNELADLRNEINSEDAEIEADLDKVIKIDDMSNKQLQTLNKLIKSVHHISVQKNKAFSDGINENIHDLGISVIRESRKVREEKRGKPGRTEEGDRKGWGEGKPLRNVLNFLDNVTNYDNLSAYDFFHRIGGTMEKLYVEMRKGFDKHAWNIKKAEEAINKAVGKKDVSKWTGENSKIQKFKLNNGEVELTTAQIMSLYALSKRPAAQEHLMFGGIQVGHSVAKGKIGKKDVASQKVYQLTPEELGEITSSLTEEQKEFADEIVRFMSTECAAWGNEASMKLYGYKKFGEKYYFPMQVAKSSLAQSFETKGSKKVQNAGATQTLAKGARNPLVLNDFFDVVTEHIATMSLYNSEALPMLDMERVLNYARWEINETEFGAEREYGATAREEFVRTWGEQADKYIKKLMKDINGDRGGESSIWDKFLSNAKKVSVGGNTRVFLQQFTAVTRALNFINPIDFVGTFKKDNTKKMLEHSAIAYWKDLGFYDINVGRSLKSILFEKIPVIDKLTLEPYGWADKTTWSAIWGACEHEVKRTTDLAEGSEEFYKKVAERFDYVIDRSQVVDSVFHRTQSMRSTNSFAKASTAFMSEPLKEINMIRTEILDAVKNKTKMKTLPKVLTIYTASAALVALAQLVPDMVRKEPEDWYDEDEKKKNTKEMWQTEFFENFVESLNPMTKVPFVSDIYEMYKGFTQERFELSSIEDLIESVEKSKDDKKTPWQRVWNVISSLAVFKGIPAKNITREFKSYGAALFRIKDGTEYGDYLVTKLDLNVKNPDNKSKFMKFYTAAVNAGHSEAAVKIMEDYLASNSKDFEKNKDALNAAKKLIKASEKAGEKTLMYELPSKSVSVGREEYRLEGKEYFDYAETAADKLWELALEVTSEEGFGDLSAKYQYEALAKAKSYAESLAKQEAFSEYELPDWMQKVQEGETSIMQEIQNNIATDEKSRIGKELYQASLESEEKYNEVLKEYEDKFGVDYMVGAITDEMKKTSDYKKEPDKYKKQLADDYLIDALIDAAKNSDEYKKDVAEYKKQFTVNTSGLSAYASAEAKKLRAEAATYYANKDNVVNYEGSGSFKKYDDTLSSKMNINDYIVFMAELSEYKNALGKSSLKAAEAVSFINRYSHPREIKRNLFKIVMPKAKKIPY